MQDVQDDEVLHPLVKEFGAQRVWDGFMELFGYPPTWQPGLKELIALKDHLTKEN